MLAAVNAQRTAGGLAPLEMDPTLAAIGRERARDMIDNRYFGHNGPDGALAVQTLLSKYGVSFALAGENLARNNYSQPETVAIAIQGFLASASHRDNLFEGAYKRLGVGARQDGSGMFYYALVFAG